MDGYISKFSLRNDNTLEVCSHNNYVRVIISFADSHLRKVVYAKHANSALRIPTISGLHFRPNKAITAIIHLVELGGYNVNIATETISATPSILESISDLANKMVAAIMKSRHDRYQSR